MEEDEQSEATAPKIGISHFQVFNSQNRQVNDKKQMIMPSIPSEIVQSSPREEDFFEHKTGKKRSLTDEGKKKFSGRDLHSSIFDI